MARFVHPHFQKSRDLLRGSYDYAVGHRADFVGRASAAIQKEIDRHAAAPAAGPAEAGQQAAGVLYRRDDFRREHLCVCAVGSPRARRFHGGLGKRPRRNADSRRPPQQHHEPNLREAGIGILSESNPSTSVGPLVVSEDFAARSNSGAFILGSAYNDLDHDNFYSAGEGLGSLVVSAAGATVTSWASGGFTLNTQATGLQTVAFSGAGLPARSARRFR